MNGLVNRAFLFALRAHDGQKRKDGKPYIVHPFAVANELAKNGADDDLIAAGLLHDTIEDTDTTPDEIKDQFGSEVLRLIMFDTENKSLSWEQRKTATLKALENCDRKCAMLICSDKLANIKDVAENYRQSGESVWSSFKRGREKQEWLYREYITVLDSLSDLKMYNELKSTVETVFKKRGKTKIHVKTEVKNNICYVAVSGNISSVNAGEFEKALSEAPGSTESVIIDASALEYISSAGLRVILSLKKRCKDISFRIVGVNAEVMSIFDVTGFSEIMDIEPAARQNQH